MKTRRVRSVEYKKKNSSRRKRNLFIFLGLLIVGGIYFSKGSLGQFFKVFAIEIVSSIFLFYLITYLKNKRKRKTRNTGKDTYSNDSLRGTEFNGGSYTKSQSSSALKRTSGKNFNWVIESENSKETSRVQPAAKASVTTGKNLTSNGKEKHAGKDLKAQVANWIENVNYSNTVFRRIIENSSQSNTGIENNSQLTKDIDKSEDVIDVKSDKPSKETEELHEPSAMDYEDTLDEGTFDISANEQQVEQTNYEEEDSLQPSDIGFFHIEEITNDKNKEDMDTTESLKGFRDVDYSLYRDNNVQKDNKTTVTEYIVPPMDLLKDLGDKEAAASYGYNSDRNARKLIDTLESFGVGAKIINISEGPAVTRYEIQPDYGVKVSKIVSLTDDIALNLAAVGVRIEAPIPGKAAIGIEIPNAEVTPVLLREVIESDEFQNHPSKIAFAVGKDIAGNSVVADIAVMPHLLIAGATGSGKSVCINTLVTSILYKSSPDEVKLLMVDPKVVELSIYNGIPHLLIPVVTDPKKAAGALNWAVQEMTNRYKLFADSNVRDLKGYNLIMKEEGGNPLPQIVIIIDELADLMMVAPNEVEDCICRLAQMARAAGMHLVIATQRPSVNVITGVIKANIPSRISFAVSSQVDSRTILDMAGAEKLLGRGDMLFYPLGTPKPVRVQGALITDKEVETIVSNIKSKEDAHYDEEVIEKIESHSEAAQLDMENDDELLPQVINMVIEQGQASTSLIQRKFKIGYSRAARILDQLEANGVVGPFEGSKPRKVLMTKQQWLEMS
ncbi:MAG: DNA translocase FtsK [Bacillota bacterium]